ncbi:MULTISPECIES: phosphoribosylaminoimidazolecarboxamide formyltransferase [Bacillota]|jgi:phosphoribosylaminoimidazolecarboxamide formyltransferase / IMP cyclohydrolase|uniref:Phosphoribosylaminoimidazolecarboxamide formyltransferase n=1 Tax=Amedibacillus hominis TaxID=2897776 RepID=A0ABS9R8Y7_9FIRM|nr:MULTISPECIES: phosphoribosylaminoimidazolecarboxamide formyltransferase [Bacillota]MCH4286085.1 phosphoribosylaminoimidazolecarboxamide formyltransferase [Amedibacillus hominis]RGB53407.1 phosphoribosylaminoimidazolecarboxamide formyltransferase [Absiella sp. AM22-9]RGB59220.1 phosphoribosylaminoimidazolecarboxamide formyltransferase [Absiella sp. AM10-20]RGB67474.1 phosphoribosylaminoimidazolecarboxamide formyltransferase [Absiella sp. AM09-45]RGB76841.1 phosphoribosylaminoimidazolecarboxa
MKEMELKYGCNPNQKPARIYMKNGELPITVLNGKPGYINLLDAFNSWQLVRELKEATGLPSAASFKHVSPAGAAVYVPLDDVMKQIYFTDGLELSPIASAYVRARGSDRMSSYGDFAALSDICDETCARYIAKEVSDGVIAPGYTPEALEILKKKKKGNYVVIQMDEAYVPEEIETKDVFGITFEQGRNNLKITEELFEDIPTVNKALSEEAKRDLIVALITLKYTQSNSVCYVKDGQAIGIGAGQQSRVHCTRLAGNKADNWYLRQNEKVLNLPFKEGIRRADRDNAIDVYISDDYEDVLADGVWENTFTTKPEPFTREEKKAWLSTMKDVALGSDAFFPFGDNIERAHKSGVTYIAQAGGSIRDDNVIETCDKYDIVMAFTHARLFHH